MMDEKNDDGEQPHPIAFDEADLPSVDGTEAYHPDNPQSQDEAGDVKPEKKPFYRAISVCAADVVPSEVEWLWSRWLPRGVSIMLDGDPDLGKSTLTLSLAAALTTGSPWPDGRHPEVGTVVICSSEDMLDKVVVPRLMSAGADLHRVHLVKAVMGPDEEALDEGDTSDQEMEMSLPQHTEALEQMINEVGASLVIVDPLMAYLDGDVNAHIDQEVRRALLPLARMAERTNACLLMVRHLNKAGGAAALYRGGGSIGIIGQARGGLIVAKHPEDLDTRVLAVGKHNLSTAPPSLTYKLTSDLLRNVGRIEWTGTTDLTVEQLLAPPRREREAPARSAAENFILDALAGGPRLVSEIEPQAERFGITKRTLKRARQHLETVDVYREGFGADQAVWWRLQPPEDSDSE
jgi:hypothetical protein